MFIRQILSYINSSDEEQIVLDNVRTLHHKLCSHFSVQKNATETIEKLKNYIEKLVQLEIELDEKLIFDSLVYAYQQRNKRYPSDFTMRLALEYIQNNQSNVLQDNNFQRNFSNSSTHSSVAQYSNKILGIEQHLERIKLLKLQLTKNLKELESQGQEHLWIDPEFIDPALDTLKGSLAQVQDIENRMLVLKVTYQDYQG